MPIGAALAPVGGFLEPNQVATVQYWYDAERLTGLGSGSAVGTWTDRGGSSFHATQATASKQPIYNTSAQNGLPAVSFDGVDDFLGATSGKTYGSGSLQSFIWVGRQATGTGLGGAISYQETDNIPVRLAEFVNATSGRRFRQRESAGTGYTTVTHATLATAWGIGIVSIGTAGTLATLNVNGSDEATATGSGTWGTELVRDLFLGAQNAGSVNFLNGTLGEVLIIDQDLDTWQRLQMARYAHYKWAVPWL